MKTRIFAKNTQISNGANKKLTKIRRISALVPIAIFAQIAANLPIANAAVSGQPYVLSPVVPYLSADLQLPDPNKRKSSPELLTIIQGSFLAAYNSPKESGVAGGSKNLDIKVKELLVSVSAYSSTPDQTDDSPFVTACGTYVRDGIIAANFLPFGTKIKIPEIFGDKIFTVEDRMNSRYWHKIDIWFPNRQGALEFGTQTAKIQIIES
jgi:3D (Asp-Asp-Asp) domain-containing protein